MQVNTARVKKILWVLIIALLIAAVYFAASYWERTHSTQTIAGAGQAVSVLERTPEPDTGEAVYYKGQWYIPKSGIETLLVIGVDDFALTDEEQQGYTNSAQADFLALIILDTENERISVLQLNRDTMAEIPVLGVNGEAAGSRFEQLALAHTYGSGREDSCENTVEAVSDLLYGTRIDDYASFTMAAVEKLNDAAGGVTVTITDDFSAVDASLVQGTSVTLLGAQALHYVRARSEMEDSTNLARMERQRQYMQSLLSAVRERMREDDGFVLNTYAGVAQELLTSCTVEEMARLGDCILKYEFEGIYALEGDAVQGKTYIEFYPDEAALRRKITELLYQLQ